ncbi:MAG: hypothetical protein MI864_21265 [Pseudomonadales bacterium]|nr:hypothetical protein [Pseudomonadales bacterium]
MSAREEYAGLLNIVGCGLLFFSGVHTGFLCFYEVQEFNRPYGFIGLPILFFGMAVSFLWGMFGGRNIKIYLTFGFCLGGSVALFVLIINFLFHIPVNGPLEVVRATRGWGESMNWKVKLSDGQILLLNVRDVAMDEDPQNVNLHLYKGALGFYFGDWETIADSLDTQP